jgi:hypothetical protein
VYSNSPHTIDDLKMAITEYIRNVDRAILNKIFENAVRRVNKCLETGVGHFEHYLLLSVLYSSEAQRLFDQPVYRSSHCPSKYIPTQFFTDHALHFLPNFSYTVNVTNSSPSISTVLYQHITPFQSIFPLLHSPLSLLPALFCTVGSVPTFSAYFGTLFFFSKMIKSYSRFYHASSVSCFKYFPNGISQFFHFFLLHPTI